MTKGVTPLILQRLEEAEMSLEEFFKSDKSSLIIKLGIKNNNFFDSYKRDELLFNAEKELSNIEKHNVNCHFYGDDNYPWRLIEVPDAPIMLYSLGDCDLNFEHPVSVVGTRRCTAMGVDFTKKFVKELSGYFPDLTIVSGLAYGIDSTGHLSSIEQGIKTVAVVAHGLDTIYPAAHRELAKNIIRSGGAIVTEYPFGTKPYQSRFLERNRIVAGMSDAVVVVESEIRGGAMSTANIAFNYNREVFAMPGRITDIMSSGCNNLIRRNKAHLMTCAADFVEQVDWTPLGLNITPGTRSLFPELEGDAKRIYDILRFSTEPKSLDSIHQELKIPMPSLMGLMGELEFDGIVVKLPGNRYEIGS